MALTWSCRIVDHQLVAPLATAAGTITRRRSWHLEVCDEAGVSGRGEAAPLAGFGGESSDLIAERLADLPRQPAEALALAAGWSDAPCAAAAVVGALAERTARARGLPLAASLAAAVGSRCDHSVRCNALLARPDPAAARARVAAGFGALKWKSSGDPERDAADLRRLRQVLGPGPRLRLDANGTWSLAATERFAEAVADCDLDYLEQPLAVGHEAELAALVPLKLRVALDESIRSLADVEQVCRDVFAEVLVVKPQWCGGFPVLRRIVAEARRRHPRRIVVSSALDGPVGRGHALHAAAALGLAAGGEHHGLATGHLLRDDGGPLPAAGRLAIGREAGLGLA